MKKIGLIAIAVAVVVVVAVAAFFMVSNQPATPTLTPTPTPTSTGTKHYSGSGISFDYPDTWGTETPNTPDMIVALGDRQAGVVFVAGKSTMPSGSTLKIVNDQVVMSMNPTRVISGSFPVVDGVTACETVFEAQDARIIFVCLEKNGMIYSMFGYASPEGFDAARTGFDMAINSFKVTFS